MIHLPTVLLKIERLLPSPVFPGLGKRTSPDLLTDFPSGGNARLTELVTPRRRNDALTFEPVNATRQSGFFCVH